jgi:hypothetical protein
MLRTGTARMDSSRLNDKNVPAAIVHVTIGAITLQGERERQPGSYGIG